MAGRFIRRHHQRPRRRLFADGDGIFQIQDDAVRREGQGFLDAPSMIARRE